MTNEQPARPTIDIEVACVVDGFPVTIRKAGATTEHLNAIISRLWELGATPPAPPVAAAAPPVAAAASSAPPVCRLHSKPMKPSTKAGGGWFCSVKLADDTYCKEKA